MIYLRNRIFSKRCLFQRSIHTTLNHRRSHKFEEIKIPVPWGHVAGKWWGMKSIQPIIAIHGLQNNAGSWDPLCELLPNEYSVLAIDLPGKWWGKKTIQPIIAVHGQQDNAGSWDPLCELLPAEYSVLAIDLPGHGYSSYLPPFQNYYHTDFVAILRRIKKHLDMDKMHLLAHSEGSAICFSYATVFPDDVESYFGIDYLTNCYENETDKADSLCSIIDEKIKYGLRNNELSKTRTWDESKRTWIIAFPWSLNEKSAEILMKRGVARMPDGKYRFSRDQRMKAYEACVFTPEQVIKLAGKIKCHVRLIKATNSTLFDVGLTYCPGIFDIIQQKAKSFKLFEIEGGHHVHMDLPEKILPWFLELHERPITTV